MSFAAGEISPVLHVRTDLTRYRIALAELVNMIVLPQGGVTRRAGMNRFGSTLGIGTVKLIPFEYNTTDSVMLEFGDRTIRVWQKTSSGVNAVAAVNGSPYTASEVKDLRYVQSGNVMFLTHKNHKPMMLRRNSLTSWTLEELPYKGGPWIEGSAWNTDAVLSIDTSISSIYSTANIFSTGLEGTLLKIEYAVNGKTSILLSGPEGSENETEPFEVKGTLNIMTAGEWRGLITIWRKVSGGTWLEIRQYRRTDTEKQGQWDITITETEDYVLYKVSAWHETLREAKEKEPIFRAAIENDYKRKRSVELPVRTEISPSSTSSGSVGGSVSVGGSISDEEGVSAAVYDGEITGTITNSVKFEPVTIDSEYDYEEGNIGTLFTKLEVKQMSSEDDTPATILISSSGFLKNEIYKITEVKSSRSVKAELQTNSGKTNENTYRTNITLWSMGAWGNIQGYPRACAMYQDRLVLAWSSLQPQTIWMSRTGDYADFSTSDPLRDDDAVNITLAGSRADGIHSLIAAGDLLVFTHGDEWKIKGAGNSGAITPTALATHQQTSIGTRSIQPVIAGGNVILVQAQGKKVYALGYDLNTDGYTGSEISIMSSHMFEGKKIIDMAYQQEPDSLLWFVLDDGTCAVCTYNPEHEVIGWGRQVFREQIAGIARMTGDTKTEIFFWSNDHMLQYLKDRTSEAGYTDNGNSYESRMRTLRLAGSGEDGSAFTSEKLIARLIVSVLRSSGAWAAPGDYSDEAHNWERRRRIEMDYTEYLQDEEIQLDNGFSTDACIQIRSMDDKPLTVAGITPIVAIGG